MKRSENKPDYGLQIAYTVMLDLFLPAQFIIVLISLKIAGLRAEAGDAAGTLTGVFFFMETVYFAILAALGILNIVRSFKAYKSGMAETDTEAASEEKIAPEYFVNSMLILKYGTVIFYVFNFVFLVFAALIIILGSFVASRGTIIFLFMFLWPLFLQGGVIAVLFLCFLTWLTMLPGAFYGVQAVRVSRRHGKISLPGMLLHVLLQFTFMLDIFDAMYIAVSRWGCGRKSSIVIGIIYALFLFGIAALCILILSAAA